MTYSPQRGPLAGQSFISQQTYQNALARTRGYKSYAAMRSMREMAPREPGRFRQTPTPPPEPAPPQGYDFKPERWDHLYTFVIDGELDPKQFELLYWAAVYDHWDPRPHRAYAKLLEFLGLRENWYDWAVGASAKNLQRATPRQAA